jgi:cytochrome c
MLSAAFALAVLAPSTPPVQSPERPRDIWVFRSVLDNRARVVTLALHKDLWVAYDATNCGLYRAWTGGVRFEGAVYTTVHGPQPRSFGNLHLTGILDEQVWSFERGGTKLEAKIEFKGYRFENGRATLQYRFKPDRNREVWIYESPEAYSRTDDTVEFERKYSITGLRPTERIGVRLLVPATASPTTDGRFERVREVAVGDRTFVEGKLWLNSTNTRYTTNIKIQPEEEELYAAMSPPNEQQQQAPREPGVSLRVYFIGQAMERIPKLLSGQTPNYSVVIPVIDLKTDADFGGHSNHFYARITGFLNIDQPGEYTFRLTSDDGSRLMIRDELIIDHDGLHSATPKDGSFRLSAGEHPFEIEYFENTVDNVLKLEWKRPGATEFELIPASVFTTQAGEVRVTSPGRKAIFDPANRFRPGDGRPLEDVHPAFDLATVRPRDFRPRVGGMDFLPDGRLVVCTWDPDGAVYILENVTDNYLYNVKVKRIAAGLAEPLGLKVVNGKIYVLQKQELTLLLDHTGDEVIDEYYAVANGWGVTANFHEFAFGLTHYRNHFYAALAIAINPGGSSTQPQNQDRGKVIKIAHDGTYTFVADGLRTPNGIGFGYNGEMFVTDNQGDWLPSSKVVHVKEGAFYGSYAVNPELTGKRTETLPVVWLPQGEIGNSPSQPAPLNVGPYRNQMIHGDVTHGGVKRVFVEQIEGQLQGCVFRFTQGLEAGVNRIVWGPDGGLYIGGIGSTGNWGQEGKERFGLQRMRYNGKSVFEPLAVRAFTNGMEVELTEPLMQGMGESAGDYTVEMWKYVPTADYGGPKIDEQKLKVQSVTVSRDRKKVFLELNGLREGHVVYIRLNRGVASATDQKLWTTEAWYTLNRIPKNKIGRVAPKASQVNQLTEEEKREGFELLFDGNKIEHFRAWRGQSVPAGWTAIDGELRFTPGIGGGDIATVQQYGDFELRLEWKVSPGGNSGIMFRATEDRNYAWETGPEMQVLDDDLHPDGRNPLTSAGSNYALHAPKRDVVRPVGEWNEVRIVAKGDDIEYWLNGYKIVEYTINSPEWKELVANSKFASMPDYGQRKVGHIVLQDHGDLIAYRNIRIKKL